MLGRFRRENPLTGAARRLHDGVVARSRAPMFHTQFRVPDTIDGRFDLLTLHLFLVMERLKSEGPAGADLAAALATITFAGFENAMRDLGVSDFGMSRRIKAMANAFYGRLDAYSEAGDDATALALAITRNIYRGAAERDCESAALARYVVSMRAEIGRPESTTALLEGVVDFGPLPEL